MSDPHAIAPLANGDISAYALRCGHLQLEDFGTYHVVLSHNGAFYDVRLSHSIHGTEHRGQFDTLAPARKLYRQLRRIAKAA